MENLTTQPNTFSRAEYIRNESKRIFDLINSGGISRPYSYVVMGGPGTGKTTILLSLALQIVSHGNRTDDESEKAVLFIGQDDDRSDMIERLFSIELDDNSSPSAAMSGPCKLIFRYIDNGQKNDLSVIDAIIREVEETGVNLVAVVQDHPVILSVSNSRDVFSARLKLLQRAIDKKIPFISSMQVNLFYKSESYHQRTVNESEKIIILK